MQIFDLFNITHPVLTVPITIIIGLIFLTVLFNLFKNSFLAKYQKLEESGFWKNIWHLAKWIKGKINYLVGVYFFSMTLLFSIMVFIFRDKTFKLDLTAYILCGFISVGLSILFYTYRDINFEHICTLLRELIKHSPGDFGYQRSRWSTELLAIKINEITGCQLHAGTVRRWLPSAGLVWRRAAPTLRIRDPHKDEKMAVIHKALDECSAEHPVFYEDEVDIHLNPKIGADWQLRGQQKRVVTPGQNEKYYLAGALHSGTGKVSYVGGNSKSSALFIALLKHLKATYRRAKTITLIVDNYIIHKSRETQRWLKANPKFRVIYQPVYSPWVNHVERLWQALHDTITRNHQCRSMWQLLKKVRHFMETASPFPGGKHGQAKV